MSEVPVDTATARARCLAELASALDQTQELAQAILWSGEHQDEALNLVQRIEAARIETNSLRLMRLPRGEFDRKWSNLAPWENGDSSKA